MFKITFQIENGSKIAAMAAKGESILDVAFKARVDIDAPCSGNGTCGKCKVKLLSGTVDMMDSTHISDEEYQEGWRLACQSYVASDAVLMVPSSASAYKSDIRSDFRSSDELREYETSVNQILAAGLSAGAGYEVVSVSMDEPTLDDCTSDRERLIDALASAVGGDNIDIGKTALCQLPDALRDGGFSVNCLIKKTERGIKVLNIRPAGEPVSILGLAIDVGTTTVSATLVDLATGSIYSQAGCGNGQIKFGADVINRIIRSTKPGGSADLRKAVVDETLCPLIKVLCENGGMDPNSIVRAVISGNTTMNHLMLGIPSNSIRMEPYVPVFRELEGMCANDVGLNILPEAEVVISPNVGSYVGGDITAGTLASMLWDKDELSLLVDLGTNGELVLGNRDFLMCCACSAGPAFEGGDIGCGMRATTGAIQGCTIDSETMEPALDIIGEEGEKPVGVCGSGLISIISELFRCGIISAKGKFVKDGPRIVRDEYGAAYVLAFENESKSGHIIQLDEVDIDNFIRAKGAIFSAIRSMLNSLDMDVSCIEHIYIAGGIGKSIDMEKAVFIGMLPDIPLEMYEFIGNSSLLGSYAMLISTLAEEKVIEIGRNMTYLELSSHPGYMDEFVAACFLPHTDSSLFPGVTQL